MSGPLTEAQVELLRKRLEALHVELKETLDVSKSGAGPVSLDEPIGRVSRIDAIQGQKMVQASRARARTRLAQVRASLQLVRTGEYGECRECGDEIGWPRLNARPESPFCLDCQGRRETTR